MLILGQFATNESFFEAPASFVAAMQSVLPEGAELRPCRSLDEFRAALPDATGVVGFPFPSAWIRVARSLRFVHLLTAGIPEGLEAACGTRIALTGSAGANAGSVAEHALFLVLAAIRGASLEGLSRWNPESFRAARPLGRCRVVLAGFGPVGARLAELLSPLVGELVILSRTAREAPRTVDSFHALLDVVAGADVVVLALPSRPETRELFGDGFFEALRPDVAIVNVARGALIDEARLLAFLARNPDARYLTDVTVPEPYPDDGAFRTSTQVLVTPHVGGRSSDAWDLLAERASAAVRRAVRAIIAPEVG